MTGNKLRWVGVAMAGCVAAIVATGLMRSAPARAASRIETPAIHTKVQFNRDIRPILSENCFSCHGPDHNKRKAGLRLDQRDEATKTLKSGEVAIVAGSVEQSEAIARILSEDADEHMPPEDSGKKLTAGQIEVLKRWVQQGAAWQNHWSFIPPAPAEMPAVRDEKRLRNPIDRFVLSRLEKEGLKPGVEADRATLIRRLSLDLLGLPPTPADVDAFVADGSPDAYERLVDRLLANPHYGERMALDWLDAARFGDTHGYHIDSARDMTAWRDWVIAAFNSDMPFDQFTVEQIAGDLLPNATIEQKVASGFHRNNMVNFEGGAIAQEYLTAYNVDRVNTTGSTWLGLTIGCSQCHDHKFDPITQKDFYQFYAFFNGIAEKGLDGKDGNAAPVMSMPTAAQQKELNGLGDAGDALRKRLDAPNAEWDARQAEWEQEEIAATSGKSVQRVDWVAAEPSSAKSSGGAKLEGLDDKSILASGANPAADTYKVKVLTQVVGITGVRIEFLPDDSQPAQAVGRSANGNMVLTKVRIGSHPMTDTTIDQPSKLKAVAADFSQDAFPAANLIESKPGKGWGIYPEVKKAHALTFELAEPINWPGGAFLTLTLEFKSPFGQHTAGRFRVMTTSSADPLAAEIKPPAAVAGILHLPVEKRSPEQVAAVRTWFRENRLAECKPLREELVQLRRQATEVQARVRTTQVMGELPKPRDTFILLRGQYDKPGEKVSANTPASLPPIPAGLPHNRLGLARWLIDPANPLTARVIVNRYWQAYFGTGIVKTAEDFGVQGEYPSHPELLDWLATEFTARHWDIKAMQKLIVTSATYRQSSRATAEQVARDPENRLLSHGPRFRLSAEFVRDEALAVSGLLNMEIGGDSVLPYQPPGLWEELMSRSDGEKFTAQTYVQDHGPRLYRRGMYTFWKRTSPPASLTTFDAPDREVCVVRRSRTNTPLQALALMNDPTFVEAARMLADRALAEGGETVDAKIAFVFKLATARAPVEQEMKVLKGVLDRERKDYARNANSAAELLAVGESPSHGTVDASERAAWTMLCSAILNLDETVTKN